MEKKPWYKSKIALLGIVMGTIGLTDLSFHWLTGAGVTADQIAAVKTALPDVANNIQQAVESRNYFGIITAVGGYLGAIWRVWFTSSQIT